MTDNTMNQNVATATATEIKEEIKMATSFVDNSVLVERTAQDSAVNNSDPPPTEPIKKASFQNSDAEKYQKQYENTPKRQKRQAGNVAIEQLKEELKQLSASTLESHGFLRRANKSGYVCPFCGNGEGEDGTGIEEHAESNGVYTYHCFKCSESFDNIRIFASAYNLDERNDFKEILQRAAVKFGIISGDVSEIKQPARNTQNKNTQKEISEEELAKQKAKQERTEKEIKMIRDDIELAADELKKFVESNDGKWRGLTFDTLNYFGCGYLVNWCSPKNIVEGKKPQPSRRVIIPSGNHYVAVLLESDRTEANKELWKMHAGKKYPFGIDKVPADAEMIIVVEGEVDALSIYQATQGKYFVIATGGASEKKFINILQDKFQAKLPRILILFDADSPGRDNAPKRQAELQQRKFPAVCNFLFNEGEEEYKSEKAVKDFNDVLIEQGDESLATVIEKIIQDAQDDFSKIETEFKNDEKFSDETDSTARADRHTYSTQQILGEDCPIDLNIPFGFWIDEFGIERLTKDTEYVKICHTPLLITKRFEVYQSQEIQFELAYCDSKKHWRRLKCSAGTIADNKKIIQLAEQIVGFTSANAKYLSQFLMDLLHTGDNAIKIPTVKLFKQPGWVDDTCAEFVYPASGKLKDGTDYIVKCDGFDYEKIFAAKGDRELWKKKFKEVIKQGGIFAKLLIGAAVAAPLVKIFDKPNIQFHLSAKRGVGKTALFKFAGSIFGNPSAGFLTRTFAATAKNQLFVAGALRDLPQFLDELESLSPREVDNLPKMIYDYYGGVANQANKRNGEARPAIYFSGSRISTGERDILKSNDKAGAFKRLISVRAEKLFEDKFASDLHKFSENNFGHFGREWVYYIQSHKDNARKKFSSVEEKFDSNENNVEPAILSGVVTCYTAFELFGEMIEYTNVDDDLKQIIALLPTKEEVDETKRALADLESWIVSHPKYFEDDLEGKTKPSQTEDDQDKTTQQQPQKYPESKIAIYGRIFRKVGTGKFAKVAILPTALRKILVDELGYSSLEHLISDWAVEGYITTDKKNKSHQDRAYINGKQTRAYIFVETTFNFN